MRILGVDELAWDKLPEKNRRVFLRVDFNVPMKAGKIQDDFRIRQTLPTIQKLRDRKCTVVMGAHLGRPQKKTEGDRKTLSLMPIAEHLAGLVNEEVIFSHELCGSGVRKLVMDARTGPKLILLENLRFDAREEANQDGFAEKLFEDKDVYINDAFGACHRAHASIHALPLRARWRAMGELLKRETEVLHRVLHSPKDPQMAVLGGAKIEDKILVIEALMKSCSTMCFGGKMGQIFLAARGVSIGANDIAKESIQVAKRLMADAKASRVRFLFPVDGVAAENYHSTESSVVKLGEGHSVDSSLQIFDVGPQTIENWKQVLSEAKSVIWNGPLGVFENPAFANGTLNLVDFLKAERSQIESIVGGGETVSAVGRRGAMDDLFHVSTGGGAMLEYLEGKTLPGLEALQLREREINDIQEGRFLSNAS